MNKFNWKKSFRKIPAYVEQKLKRISDNKVVVACVRKIPASDLADDKYGHLRMSMKDDAASFPARITPEATLARIERPAAVRTAKGYCHYTEIMPDEPGFRPDFVVDGSAERGNPPPRGTSDRQDAQ